MTSGILIIALDKESSTYYGYRAYMLACSIKLYFPNTNVAIVHNEHTFKHFTPESLEFIDNLIECPQDYYIKDGKAVYQRVKCCGYNLTPFENTVMLDADSIWFYKHDPQKLFDSLAKGGSFNCANYGFADLAKLDEGLPKLPYTYWIYDVREQHHFKKMRGALEDVKEAFGLDSGRMYQLQTSFVYFRKCEEVGAMFADIQDIFDNPRLKTLTWNADLPDEYAFNIGVCKHGLYPDNGYKPIFMPSELMQTTDYLDRPKILKSFYAMTMAGNMAHSTFKKLYHDLFMQCFREWKKQYGHINRFMQDWRDKKHNLIDRAKL